MDGFRELPEWQDTSNSPFPWIETAALWALLDLVQMHDQKSYKRATETVRWVEALVNDGLSSVRGLLGWRRDQMVMFILWLPHFLVPSCVSDLPCEIIFLFSWRISFLFDSVLIAANSPCFYFIWKHRACSLLLNTEFFLMVNFAHTLNRSFHSFLTLPYQHFIH